MPISPDYVKLIEVIDSVNSRDIEETSNRGRNISL